MNCRGESPGKRICPRELSAGNCPGEFSGGMSGECPKVGNVYLSAQPAEVKICVAQEYAVTKVPPRRFTKCG